MLDKYSMEESREMKTSVTTTSPTNDIRFPYREAVGSLLYMTPKTRPDMAFDVNVEIRTLENPDSTAVQNVEDNQSAIKLIESGQVTRRSKHTDVRYLYISEQLKEKLFSNNYCNTEAQVADILTKLLLSEKFVKFRYRAQKEMKKGK
jgi:hypothetical protein